MEWSSPAQRFSDYVGAVRDIWRSFETGAPLKHDGEFFKLSLLTREFNPGPRLATDSDRAGGVGRLMCRLAGAAADRYRGHLIVTPKYFEEVVRPALREGAARSSRDLVLVIATSFQAVAMTKAACRRG